MIYIVMGCTGEYSGFSAWHVKAFADRAEAEALLALLVEDEAKIRLEEEDDFGDHRANVHDPEPMADGIALSDFDFRSRSRNHRGVEYGIVEVGT